MEDKTISNEKVVMLFKATESQFRLALDFGKTFPKEYNVFQACFAGLRQSIDILGLGADYLTYVASKEQK